MLLAWIITRYRFPGRKFLDGLMDFTFCLTYSGSGIDLSNVVFYTRMVCGGLVLDKFDIKVINTWIGIAVAMSFTSLPFVVRTVQPVLEES